MEQYELDLLVALYQSWKVMHDVQHQGTHEFPSFLEWGYESPDHTFFLDDTE